MTEFVAKLQKRDNGGVWICAIDGLSHEAISELRTGCELLFDIRKPRNLRFHKKFFAMLKVSFDMIDERERDKYNIHNMDEFLIRLKIDLGLYDLWIASAGSHVPEGTPVFIPRSISFAKMDDTKFEKFYKQAISVIIGRYVVNQNDHVLMQMVDKILRFD